MRIRFYHLGLLLLFASCISEKNSSEFIEKTTGRYLFNANETIEIYFKEAVLFAKWRGKDDIKPLKVNDSSFYFKGLNEKLVFKFKPLIHIELAEKREHNNIKYHFKKLGKDEKTPNEYLANSQFKKALNSFLIIKKNDSLSPVIRESNINLIGYNYIRKKEFIKAIEVFKINAALYPKSSNVFDSLGEAYLLNKDTANAIINYEKSLDFNKNNRSATRKLKRILK